MDPEAVRRGQVRHDIGHGPLGATRRARPFGIRQLLESGDESRAGSLRRDHGHSERGVDGGLDVRVVLPERSLAHGGILAGNARRRSSDLLTLGGERLTISGPMRARGAAVAVPAVVGSLWVQAHRAAHAQLPEFDDLDLTGYYGTARDVTADPLRVAVVGDSTLTGPGLGHAREVFVAEAAGRLDSFLHLSGHAIGGSKIADVLMRQLPAVLDERPDLVVVSVGANDAVHSTPLSQFERDFRAVVGALDRARIHTVICGLIDLSVIPRVPVALKSLLGLRGAAYERRTIRATHPTARATYVGAGRHVNEVFRAAR